MVHGSRLMVNATDGSWFFDERSDKVDDKVNGSNLTLTEIEAGSKEYLRTDGYEDNGYHRL